MTIGNNRLDLRNIVPEKIVRGANLKSTVDALLATFKAGEQRNAELINEFFDQPYFRGEESLIDKLVAVKPDIKFEDIKDEGINLALVLNYSGMYDLKLCLDKITNPHIKEQFIIEIHDKVQAILGLGAPYDHFDDPTECQVVTGDTNVLGYFNKVVDYLKERESATNGKKVNEVLKEVVITNENLNLALPAGERIPTGVNITDPSVPENTKNDFDTLLSFEIGKEADRTIYISDDFSKKLQGLLTNSIPAINTIVGESEKYKYDESKLGHEYTSKLQLIKDDTNLDENEKNKQIKELKWEYYIKYLKRENAKLGNTLEELYNNNFDYSKVNPNSLKKYFDEVANIRLGKLFDKSTTSGAGMNEYMKLHFGNVDEFKRFYKELTAVDPANPTLDVNIPGATRPLPIHRKIVEGENVWLKDIEQFGKNANNPFDAFPMEFSINKTDIERLNITIENKTKLLNFLSKFDKGDKYEIKGENIGILIYLFFVINGREPITTMNLENQKEVEKLFGQAKNHEDKHEDEDPENNNEGSGEITPKKFKEEFEKKGPGKFENGSEIWIPVGKSELPGGGYQWMKIKISKLNMAAGTFTGTVFGGELKFDSKWEGKSEEFKMDKKTLDRFSKIAEEKSGSADNVWLQPNPENSNFNSFRESLNNKLGTSDFTFPPTGIIWDGSKFKQKIMVDKKGKQEEEEVDVKYFGTPSDDKATYKIEYNPIRKSFTVYSTFNGDEKGKDGKSEKKRFSYKRDMDRNNFLIFFNQKGLTPQTEQEAQNAVARQDKEFKIVNGRKWKLNRFSINNLKHGLKDIFGAIKKKIDDYNKGKDEEFRKAVESPILNALAAFPLLPPSLKSAIGERQQEIYNEEFNGAWTEIENYLKALQSDEQFADTFDQVPSHVQTIYGKSYKKFITDLFDKKGETSNTEKRKAAALLLANLQKGASAYRGLSGRENSGLWVKVILGNDHYEQFLRDKQNCINDLKNAGSEKDQLQDVLATCEMDYIMNNVNGANGKLKYFGSHEGRGIPGNEDTTNYKPNPSKIILSEKFAKELKNSYKGWFNKDSVESALSEIKHNDFNLAKEDFKRLIKSSRFPGAIANLKKMFLLAKNDEQQAEYQKCFLLYMLSGVLDVNGKKDLRKQTYQWAKTMSFLPGMLAKQTGHSEQVVALMDDFCKEKGYGKFSDSVKTYFRRGDLKNGDLKIEELIKELDSRWSLEKMEEFEKYSKSEFLSKPFAENSPLKMLQESALKTDIENIDNSLLDNPLVANSGGLLSNINVVDDRILFKNGEFEGKDQDEKGNRKAFWNKIKGEINAKKADNLEDVKLLLTQYFNRFRFSDREEIYRWIKTAYERKDQIGKMKYFENDEGIRDPMGIIGKDEIESIIRYTFKGHTMYNRFNGRLPDELNDVLDAFQDKFSEAFYNGMLKNPEIVSDIFNIGNAENIEAYGLGSRRTYNWAVTGRENSVDEEGTGKGLKDIRNRVRRNFISGNFINKKIADMENSFKKLPDKQYKSYVNATLNNLMSRFYDEPERQAA